MDLEFKSPKTWVSFDMEMNNDKDGRVTDIIQLGAVAFNIDTGDVEDVLKVYINTSLQDFKTWKKLKINGTVASDLSYNIPLSDFITTLTGITETDLFTKGVSLMKGYNLLQEFLKRNKAFRDPICWGGNDALYLKNQLIQKCGWSEEVYGRFAFGSNYFDTKKIFQIYCQQNDLSIKSGMAKSMRRLGLTFTGRIHDALDDSINNKEVFMFLKGKLDEKAEIKNGDSFVIGNKKFIIKSIDQASGFLSLSCDGKEKTLLICDVLRTLANQNNLLKAFE